MRPKQSVLMGFVADCKYEIKVMIRSIDVVMRFHELLISGEEKLLIVEIENKHASNWSTLFGAFSPFLSGFLSIMLLMDVIMHNLFSSRFIDVKEDTMLC